MLSRASNEILIKDEAQAIPTFAMGCFDMSTMICRYWWSNQETDKKMHWINWQKLTDPKGEGGWLFETFMPDQQP